MASVLDDSVFALGVRTLLTEMREGQAEMRAGQGSLMAKIEETRVELRAGLDEMKVRLESIEVGIEGLRGAITDGLRDLKDNIIGGNISVTCISTVNLFSRFFGVILIDEREYN